MGDWTTVSEDDVLLVVDVQNDFCPGGSLAVPAGNDIVPAINGLMRRFPHVVLTQDWHPEGHSSFASVHPGTEPLQTVEVDYGTQILWPDHCVQGTLGAAFHRDLEINRAELIIRKGFRPAVDSYSAFYENDRRTGTGLTGYLRERGFKRIFACGIATDVCVRWSVLDGRREGFEVALIENASAAIDHDGSLAAAMSDMREAGVEVLPNVPH